MTPDPATLDAIDADWTRRRCSSCHVAGHYAPTCPTAPRVPAVVLPYAGLAHLVRTGQLDPGIARASAEEHERYTFGAAVEPVQLELMGRT